MNSYPTELLCQLSPLMFVAGLSPSNPSVPSGTSGTPASPKAVSPGLPPPAHTRMASSHTISVPNIMSSPPAAPSESMLRDGDPFTALCAKLQTVLTAKRKGAIWDTERLKEFHIVMVDKVSCGFTLA